MSASCNVAGRPVSRGLGTLQISIEEPRRAAMALLSALLPTLSRELGQCRYGFVLLFRSYESI
jgi:hypothetical protein